MYVTYNLKINFQRGFSSIENNVIIFANRFQQSIYFILSNSALCASFCPKNSIIGSP